MKIKMKILMSVMLVILTSVGMTFADEVGFYEAMNNPEQYIAVMDKEGNVYRKNIDDFKKEKKITKLLNGFTTNEIHLANDEVIKEKPKMYSSDLTSSDGYGEEIIINEEIIVEEEITQEEAVDRANSVETILIAEPLVYYHSNSIDTNATEPNDVKSSDRFRLEQINFFEALDDINNLDVRNTDVSVAVIDNDLQPFLSTGGTYEDELNIVKEYKAKTKEEGLNKAYSGVSNQNHGSHVSGLVGAVSNNGKGIVGIASGVKIYACNVFYFVGNYYTADTTSLNNGLDWAIANNVDVINMSLGSRNQSLITQSKLREAKEAGIVMVAASGNNSNIYISPSPQHEMTVSGTSSTVTSFEFSDFPAAYPEVINVGALQRYAGNSTYISDYTSVGGESLTVENETGTGSISYTSNIDVVAFGSEIYSLVNQGLPVYVKSGTSMASPQVAGYAALIKAKYPSATVDAIYELIRKSGDKTEIIVPDGNGYFTHTTSGYPTTLNLKNFVGNGLVKVDTLFKFTAPATLSLKNGEEELITNFDKNNHIYEINVDETAESLFLSTTKAYEEAVIKVDGVVKTDVSSMAFEIPFGTTEIAVNYSLALTGVQEEYTVKVVKASSDLTDIKIDGLTIPEFLPSVTTYTANNLYDNEDVIIAATKLSNTSTLEISVDDEGYRVFSGEETVSIPRGKTIPVKLKVKDGADGSDEKIYIVEISRDGNVGLLTSVVDYKRHLDSVDVISSALVYDANVLTYDESKDDVKYIQFNMTRNGTAVGFESVVTIKEDGMEDVIYVDSSNVLIPIYAGDNAVMVEVSAATTPTLNDPSDVIKTEYIYNVNVTKSYGITGISAINAGDSSEVMLDKTFDIKEADYTILMDSDFEAIELSALKLNENNILRINGEVAESITVNKLTTNSEMVVISVEPTDLTPEEAILARDVYNVKVNSEKLLTGISFSDIPIEGFEKNTFNYTVPYATSLKLTYDKLIDEHEVSMTLDGNVFSSPATKYSNTAAEFIIKVKDVNDEFNEYTINMVKYPGIYKIACRDTITDELYEIDVVDTSTKEFMLPKEVKNVELSIYKSSVLTNITIDDVPMESIIIDLSDNEEKSLKVNSSQSEPYFVGFQEHNVLLKKETVSKIYDFKTIGYPGTTFDKETFEYAKTVPYSTERAIINFEKESEYSKVYVNGGELEYELSSFNHPLLVGLNTITFRIVSEELNEKTYTYNITRENKPVTPPPSGGGSSSGGGGGSAPPPFIPPVEEVTVQEVVPEKNQVKIIRTDGEVLVSTEVGKTEVTNMIKDEAAEEISIVAVKSKQYLDNLNAEVKIDVDTLKLIQESNKPLVVDYEVVEFNISPELLKEMGLEETFTISVNSLNDASGSLDEAAKVYGEEINNIKGKSVAGVFDINIMGKDRKIESFEEEIKVTFDYNDDNVKSKDKLVVSYFNDEKKEWEVVGGKVLEDNQIEVAVNHFSKYTVSETEAGFDDLSGHWGRDYVEVLAGRNIVKGVTKEGFMPDKSISNAEFVTLISRTLNLSKQSEITKFTDVKSTDWYFDYVVSLEEVGLLSDVMGEKFKPNEPIKRELMADILSKVYLLENELNIGGIEISGDASFVDQLEIDNKYLESVRYASSIGLINGDTSGNFNPKNGATRAESSTVIVRLLKLLNKM